MKKALLLASVLSLASYGVLASANSAGGSGASICPAKIAGYCFCDRSALEVGKSFTSQFKSYGLSPGETSAQNCIWPGGMDKVKGSYLASSADNTKSVKRTMFFVVRGTDKRIPFFVSAK